VLYKYYPTKEETLRRTEVDLKLAEIHKLATPSSKEEEYLLKTLIPMQNDIPSPEQELLLIEDLIRKFGLSYQIAKVRLHNAIAKSLEIKERFKELTGEKLPQVSNNMQRHGHI
jgi:predicted 3-demethylubiquinone-9 3-methyltransferase (glyoxalase superfamily)